ncbi:HNH endonuclease [Rubellimicrobium arenae]|uniref:HNH endonuclease n=1 Tax=Rubellimicrobium arenae TaxID=2817372 RepID=UPI001B308423|nr:HNH endonuclease [Rubellimicrobium arenae]
MARLTNLKPRLGQAGQRLRPADQSRDARRSAEIPWRAWYKTKRWQRLRWECLVRDGFTCRLCGHLESNTSQLVADHKVPHRGDPDLFWSFSNLQCLCRACHDSSKQREERKPVGIRTG